MAVRLVVVLFLIFTGASHAQQGCVGIENDIARLKCFDEAFAQIPAERSRSKDAIYTELAGLIASHYGPPQREHVVVASAFNPDACRLVLGRFAANSRNLDLFLHRVASVQLGLVENIQHGFGGFQFVMQRGKRASVAEFFGGNTGLRYDVGQLGQIANNLLPSFAAAGVSGTNLKHEPSISIELVTPDSQVDAARMLALLEELASACKS